MYMRKKEIALILAIAAVIIAGPAYVLLVRDKHTPTSTQTATDNKPTEQRPTQSTNDLKNAASFDKNKYSHDDVTSIWVVVNKQRPLNPKTYAPTDLVSVGGGQQMRSEAANALKKLIAAAKTEGLTINPLSGYRSYNAQVSVYNNEVKQYGQAVADSESARPGTSEHQTGLAIDVGGGGCGIEDCFGATNEGKWLAVNAYKYGFIIRYTSEKQQITGYRAEPWHIRYIGTDLSTEMQKQGVTTLEEFFGLPAAPNYP
jgi:D-alanyl-D-alanine carboxypeptidase